jgi:hypothetical protein
MNENGSQNTRPGTLKVLYQPQFDGPGTLRSSRNRQNAEKGG